MPIPGFNGVVYAYFLWLGSFRLGRDLLLEDAALVSTSGGALVSMGEGEGAAVGAGGATPGPTICVAAG
jgi:hypothetical protein